VHGIDGDLDGVVINSSISPGARCVPLTALRPQSVESAAPSFRTCPAELLGLYRYGDLANAAGHLRRLLAIDHQAYYNAKPRQYVDQEVGTDGVSTRPRAALTPRRWSSSADAERE
jgi:hypothetical protein